MPFSFLPKAIAPALTDISPKKLAQHGIRLLMLDFDNTIVPYTTDIPTEKMACWLNEAKCSGLAVCVVSNSRRGRVPKFCEKYGVDYILRARKPFPKGIRQCLDRYGIPASQAALVGDQIYTDTLGGNAMGVATILINAIDNHTFWLKARHVLELPFLFAARKRRINHEQS